MKTRKEIEPGAFAGRFCTIYIVTILLVLSIADVIFMANDHENVALIRSIVMAATIIIGVMLIIKSLMKKNICVKSMEQSYKLYITIAIIAVALLSIFYFMYCVKSNVNKIKEGNDYKTVKLFFGEKAAEALLDEAAEDARKDWYTVWGVMIAASAVAVPIARNMISKYSEEHEEISNIEQNEDNNL